MPASEKAEAFIIIIKRILKWIVIGVAILFASAYMKIWWDTRHDKKIDVIVYFDAERCGSERPVVVTVKNNSPKTIERIVIDLKMIKKGHSTQINSFENKEFDKILSPGQAYTYYVQVLDKRGKVLDGIDMDVEVNRYNMHFKQIPK